jgi:hypothetical protein
MGLVPEGRQSLPMPERNDLPSLRDLNRMVDAYPQLKLRAIFGCPCGTMPWILTAGRMR